MRVERESVVGPQCCSIGKVVGNQRQSGIAGMGADVQVIDADRPALPFQFRADPSEVARGFRGVGQYRQPAGESPETSNGLNCRW